MSYEALARKAWSSGRYELDPEALDAGAQRGPAGRAAAQRQMQIIAERESWDAGACFRAHKEGTMKLAPFVKFREEKFGAVLFETRSERVFTLNPAGAAVVREVIAGTEPERLPAQLAARFADPTGRIASESAAFLTRLREQGLVVA